MEIKLNVTREVADRTHQARLTAGGVDICESALMRALHHIRECKELAVDNQACEDAATWRDNEKSVIIGLAGLGIARSQDF